MSKIKKIIAIIKKLIEKGRRLGHNELNPHSKGEDLLLFIIDFFLNERVIIIINKDTINTDIKFKKINLINYFINRSF